MTMKIYEYKHEKVDLYADAKKDDGVLHLTNDSHDKAIKDDFSHLLVAYSRESCYWCKRLMPSWSAAAKKLKDVGKTIALCKSEDGCNTWKASGFGVKVYGLPTLAFYKGGNWVSFDDCSAKISRGQSEDKVTEDIVNFVQATYA